PDACGGSVEVTWTITDTCLEPAIEASAIFTVTPAPIVAITLPGIIPELCNEDFPESLQATYTGCNPGVINIGPTNIRPSIDGCAELADYVFVTPVDACGNFDTKTFTITREFDKYESCETMFARNDDDALCFLDDNIGNDGGDFNRWGWTNLVSPSDTDYIMNLYAGAAHCDISKGAHVGTATVNYNGSYMTISYNLFEGYGMNEAHVYVGCDLYPMKNGKYTVAPGQYNFNPGGSYDYVNELTIEIDDLPGSDLYVIIHGVVCEEVCKCSDGYNSGGTESMNGSGVTNCDNAKIATSSISESNEFNAYPVPFEEEVTFKYSFSYDTDVTIEIYDMKGSLLKLIKDTDYSLGKDKEYKLNLSSFGTQIFLVKLTTNKEVITKQIVSSN
ncbi:T9SS type A sorting domain-containing protein, partial [Aestuariibaculum suncheonense]